MNSFFAILFLVALCCLVAGLIKPDLFEIVVRRFYITRKEIGLIFVPLVLISFILFGYTAPAKEHIDNVAGNTVVEQVHTASIQTTAESIDPVSAIAGPAPSPAPAPVQPAAAPDPSAASVPSPAPTPVQPAASPVPSPAPTPVQPTVPGFGDGTFIVGVDIQPGTYRTRNVSGDCYFARLSGFSSSLDDILANEIAVGPAVVTISATDKGFESNRCDSWTQDLSPVTSSTTSFGDGTFIVNTDIQPGTYRNTGGTDCYYSRLAGFNATLADIIANQIASGPAVVTIAPTDVGFKSSRCGVWNKM